MKRILPVLASLLLIVFLSTSAFAAGKKSSTKAYLDSLHNQGKERVIVTFTGEMNPDVAAKHGAKVIRKLKIINALVCEIDKSKIDSLKHEANVKDVILDMVIQIPQPTERIALSKTIASLSYGGPVTIRWNNLQAGLNSKAAWDRYNLDGTGIKIAFLDSGVNYTLPDINAHYLGGEDFVSPSDENDPFTNDPVERHGTEVVSVAVGEGELKVIGPAYNASYYAVRVADATYTGLVSSVIAGIEWASTEPHKADIISMSLGAYDEDNLEDPYWPDIKEELKSACDNAYNSGVILVAGSGNGHDNVGYNYSAYPAAFNNVISVGAHNIHQSIASFSNGDVDIVAPGESTEIPGNAIYAIGSNGGLYAVSGTSFSAPHVAGLLALQLQYARQKNNELEDRMKPNNGYLWEVMKHSAHPLTGQSYDPVYQGSGKIYAARTDINDANVGSIDLMASNWPINSDFTFADYAFTDADYPVYQIGQDVNQTIKLTNLTDVLGNTTETIENLKVTATQFYYGEPNEPNLPGSSVKVFPTISQLKPNEANSVTLSYIYTIPSQITAGLKKTKIQFECNFVGNSRIIKVAYNQPNSFWYAAIPADLDLSNTVDFADYCRFSNQWQQSDCHPPDWCARADIDRNGFVDWHDLAALADHWLTGGE